MNATVVAIGQFGRQVLDRAAALGTTPPRAVQVAPDGTLPAGIGGGWAIVLADPSAVGLEQILADLSGRPSGSLLLIAATDQVPDLVGLNILLAGRGPEAAENVAVLLPSLLDGRLSVPGPRSRLSVVRLDVRPDRPRQTCVLRLVSGAARRLLQRDRTDPALRSPAWRAALGDTETASLPRSQTSRPTAVALDPLTAVVAAYSARSLLDHQIPAATRSALAILDDPCPIPMTVLAADLDCGLIQAILTGGLAAAHAGLSDLMKGVLALAPDGEHPPELEEREFQAREALEEAVFDLERRAGSLALAATFMRRSAILACLRLVSEAASGLALRRASRLSKEPLIGLLESRWHLLEALEADLEGAAAVELPQLEDGDYFTSLPDGEESGIDALLKDPGLGRALLAGGPVAHMTSRAAPLFAWVPDRSVSEQLDAAGMSRSRAFESTQVASVVIGVPDDLAAGKALELARQLAGSAGLPPTVPLDRRHEVVVLSVRRIAHISEPPFSEVEPSGPTIASSARSEVSQTLRSQPDPPVSPEFEADLEAWRAWRDGAAGAEIPPDPGLDAAWEAAPATRIWALFLEEHKANEKADRRRIDDWQSGSRLDLERASRLNLDPGGNGMSAWDAAFRWQDALPAWLADQAATAIASEGDRMAWVAGGTHLPEETWPLWCLEAIPGPADPLQDAARLVAVGLATDLIAHAGGYLAFAYSEDNGFIHTAELAPADDPAAAIPGLLAHPGAIPVLRHAVADRLLGSRYHAAIRRFAHDLGAEIATRDWLKMPINPSQRLLAEAGRTILEALPDVPVGGEKGQGVDLLDPEVWDRGGQAASLDVSWEAGVVLPGFAERGGGKSERSNHTVYLTGEIA